ncbi:hypothetical protein [Janthinobacterium sp. HH107]|uniref:hypothetical protein n=1 Tax=Janthinobacterium sp. HH107 TaxID=1537279 RepID=UPI00114D24AD|nr:hypothetical protein [Janthinobacterium sp. HH107]
MNNCYTAGTIGSGRRFSVYCVEEIEWQQFWEVSNLQAAGGRSPAAVQAGLGSQNIDLMVYVPEFFNIKGRDLPTTARSSRSKRNLSNSNQC